MLVCGVQVISFIHRMVETLGASVFPFLPKALEHLLAETEVKTVNGRANDLKYIERVTAFLNLY